jgi:hypothetical protein
LVTSRGRLQRKHLLGPICFTPESGHWAAALATKRSCLTPDISVPHPARVPTVRICCVVVCHRRASIVAGSVTKRADRLRQGQSWQAILRAPSLAERLCGRSRSRVRRAHKRWPACQRWQSRPSGHRAAKPVAVPLLAAEKTDGFPPVHIRRPRRRTKHCTSGRTASLVVQVRFGSLADITPINPDVRFTPESGHCWRPCSRSHLSLSVIALLIEVPLVFDRLDPHPLCVHEAFFKTQSEAVPLMGCPLYPRKRTCAVH